MAAKFEDDIIAFSFQILLKYVVWWTISSIGSDNGLVPNRRQAIIWTNDGIVYRRIYASLDLIDLSRQGLTKWPSFSW